MQSVAKFFHMSPLGRFAYGFLQIVLYFDAKFSFYSGDVWNVHVRCAWNVRPQNPYVAWQTKRLPDGARQVLHGNRAVGTDIVWPACLAAFKNGEKPLHEIVCIKIAAQRRSVPVYDNRSAVKTVLHEIANGEMYAAIQIRAHERETPCNLGVKARSDQ